MAIFSGPSEAACRACKIPKETIVKEVIEKVYVAEPDLFKNEIDKFQNILDLPFENFQGFLGESIGIGDTSALTSSQIQTSFGTSTLYSGKIRFDKMFENLIDRDRSCLNYSNLRVLVFQERIKTITWIGSVNKGCFENYWLPAIARERKFVTLDRIRGVYFSNIRYIDTNKGRFLFIFSKTTDIVNSSTGIWISFISPQIPISNVYDDYGARGIFSNVDSIAAQ